MTFIYRLTITAIFLIFTSNATANNENLLACNNCTQYDLESLVFSQNTIQPISTYYIFDFEGENIYGYYLFNDLEFGTKSVDEFTPSSHIQILFGEYINSRHEVIDGITSEFLTTMVTDVLNITNTNNSVSSNMSLSMAQSSNSSDAEVCVNTDLMYDYITTSSIRTAGYQRAIEQSPILQRLDNSWNRLISFTNAEITVGVVSASFFTIPTKVIMDGTGSFKVLPNPHADTFDIVDGSVLDCNGNAIPTHPSDAVGNYIFGSLDEGQNFGAYTQSFLGASFSIEHSQCTSLDFQTTCEVRGNDLVCTLIVPDCLN